MIEVLAGVGLGLLLSAPIGPMGVLAMLKQLEGHTAQALGIALGAAVADAIMAGVATLPMSVQLPFSVNESWLSGITGIIFLLVAVWVWFRAYHAEKLPHNPKKVAKAIATGFTSTILHPGNVAAFALSFGWLQAQGIVLDGALHKVLLVTGVLIGTMLMWALMLEVIAWLGRRYASYRIMPLIRQGVAVCFAAAEGVAFWRALV